MQITKLNNTPVHWQGDSDPSGLPAVFANSPDTGPKLWNKIVPPFPKALRMIGDFIKETAHG